MPTTRRSAMTLTLAAIAVPVVRAAAQQPAAPEKAASPDTRTSIHHELDFQAPPKDLYEAILDQKQFAAFSGMATTIDPTPGGAFSMFGGMIVGRNIELVANRRIVQAWRPTHWDPGVYSLVHFEFRPREGGSAVVFDHAGFPAGDHDSLDSGWESHYWAPLRKLHGG